jgi:hypothetical protein
MMLILTVFVAVYCIDNKYYLLLVAGIYPDKTSIPYLDHAVCANCHHPVFSARLYQGARAVQEVGGVIH